MLFKRWGYFKQNVLWFLCGVCTVIWILQFISPHHNQRRQTKGEVFFGGRGQPTSGSLTILMTRKFRVIKYRDGEWLEDSDVCKTNETFPHSTLHTPAGDVDIHIYPPEHDVWISGFIDREGSWELDLVIVLHNILKEHPDWIFIDIGANIGVYTVSMMKAGFEVVAIEPLVSNIQRLCRSIKKGKFNGAVRVIHNAVSDSRRRVGLGRIRFNVGGTYIQDGVKGIDPDDLEQTILLDDLVPMFQHKTVVVKMDVEQHEAKILRGASNFFKLVDVRYLLMEFQIGKHQVSSARLVTKFLKDHDMKPTSPANLNSVLDDRDIEEWPSDVMWVKDDGSKSHTTGTD